MDYSSENLISKKNIISLLILAILIVGIPVAVRLAQTTQVFAPKAAPAGEIKFVTGPTLKCTAGDCVTTDPTVELDLTSPLGPAATP